MRSVNKVILIGNLTRSPELKNTTSGQSIVTFGLATNRQWTTSSGEKRNSAEFHECVAWAKLAEICKDYLKKGMLVYVEGYLKTRSWDMEDGTRRFRTEVVLQDMIILEKRSDSDDYVSEDDEAAPVVAETLSDSGAGSDGDDSSTGDDDDDDAVVIEEKPEEAAPAPDSSDELKATLEDDNLF